MVLTSRRMKLVQLGSWHESAACGQCTAAVIVAAIGDTAGGYNDGVCCIREVERATLYISQARSLIIMDFFLILFQAGGGAAF